MKTTILQPDLTKEDLAIRETVLLQEKKKIEAMLAKVIEENKRMDELIEKRQSELLDLLEKIKGLKQIKKDTSFSILTILKQKLNKIRPMNIKISVKKKKKDPEKIKRKEMEKQKKEQAEQEKKQLEEQKKYKEKKQKLDKMILFVQKLHVRGQKDGRAIKHDLDALTNLEKNLSDTVNKPIEEIKDMDEAIKQGNKSINIFSKTYPYLAIPDKGLSKKIASLNILADELNVLVQENFLRIDKYGNNGTLKEMLEKAKEMKKTPDDFYDKIDALHKTMKQEKKDFKKRISVVPEAKTFKTLPKKKPQPDTIIMRNLLKSVKTLKKEHKSRSDFQEVLGNVLEITAEAEELLKQTPSRKDVDVSIRKISREIKKILKTYNLGILGDTGNIYSNGTSKTKIKLEMQMVRMLQEIEDEKKRQEELSIYGKEVEKQKGKIKDYIDILKKVD